MICGDLAFAGCVQIPIVGVAAQPIAQDEMTQVLVAVRAEDVQIDVVVVGPQATVLVPVWLSGLQGVAGGGQIRDVAGVVALQRTSLGFSAAPGVRPGSHTSTPPVTDTRTGVVAGRVSCRAVPSATTRVSPGAATGPVPRTRPGKRKSRCGLGSADTLGNGHEAEAISIGAVSVRPSGENGSWLVGP
jgi:hypothetical protein